MSVQQAAEAQVPGEGRGESSSTATSPAPFWVFLVGGATAVVVYVFLGRGVVSSSLYVAIGLGSAAAVLVGTRRMKPDHPGAWVLIAAGLGMSAVADLVWEIYEFALRIQPQGSIADIFYLAYYPLIAAGILLMTRARTKVPGRETLIDTGIFAAGIGFVVWLMVMRPGFALPDISAFGVFATLASPLMDLLLVAVVFRFLFVPGSRVPATWLLISGLSLALVGDELYAMTDLGHVLDPLWLVGYLLVAAAALHPSMATLTRVAGVSSDTQLGGLRRILLILALVAAIAVLIPIAPGEITVANIVFVCLFALVVLARFASLGRRADRMLLAQRRSEASLREAESKYRSLVEQLPAATFTFTEVTDTNGEYNYRSTYVSPQVEDIFGVSIEGWMNNPTLWRAKIHPDDQERVFAVVDDATGVGESYRIEYRVIPRPGELRWVREDSRKVRDSAGRPLNWQGIAYDITEEKSAELANNARVAAESANEAKSRFLSRVSHEFRTPLNAILGFGQLLELDHLSAEQTQSVAQIMASGRHLLELVDEIFELSRLESGQHAASLQPVALHPLIAGVVEAMAPLAATREIELRAAPTTSKETWVLADRRAMREVCLCLVSNAILYNRTNGWVDIRWRASEEGVLLLEVCDNGAGIPEEHLPLLWQPFERLNGDASPTTPGMGLGLSLARKRMEAMGGSLEVGSRIGEGTTFSVRLALADHA